MSWIDFMVDFGPRLLEEEGFWWSVYQMLIAVALFLYTVGPLVMVILTISLISAICELARRTRLPEPPKEESGT